jgi:hypothetical protein
VKSGVYVGPASITPDLLSLVKNMTDLSGIKNLVDELSKKLPFDSTVPACSLPPPDSGEVASCHSTVPA